MDVRLDGLMLYAESRLGLELLRILILLQY